MIKRETRSLDYSSYGYSKGVVELEFEVLKSFRYPPTIESRAGII